jgi:hypothetical protein
VQFSRHAKNVLRLHKLSSEQAEKAIDSSSLEGLDDRGNQRRITRIGDVAFIVVLAVDEPEFVITIWKVG